MRRKAQISTLMDKTGKGRNLKGGRRYAAKTHHSGTTQRPARGAQSDAGTTICGNRYFKVRAGKIRSRRF